MIRIFATAALLLPIVSFASIQGGVQGQVWEIVEPDLREVMIEELKNNKKLEEMKSQLKEDFEQRLHYVEKARIPLATEDKLYSQVIEWTLPEDKHYLAKQPDGSYKWTLLYAKGTKVYPLKAQRMDSWLFVFEAISEEQIKFAKSVSDLAKERGIQLILIMTRGNQKLALEMINSRVYTTPPDLLSAIEIPAVPALIGQRATDTDNLSIIVHGLPNDANRLLSNIK